MAHFSHQVYGSLTNLLRGLPADAAQLLIIKHTSYLPSPWNGLDLYEFLVGRPEDQVQALIIDVVAHRTSVRYDAPHKGTFDERLQELVSWLDHDGWQVAGESLVAVAPAVEESTELRDQLLNKLSASGIDTTGEIRRLIEAAASDFRSQPPDLTGSTTKTRVALETIARNGAKTLAQKAGQSLEKDTWGVAIAYLRTVRVVSDSDERMLAQAYTFISRGAHVPMGLTDVEWARLARTVALSMAYYLVWSLSAAV